MDDQSGPETGPGLGSLLDRLNAEVAALTTSLAASQALPVDLLALPGRVDDLGAGLTEIRVRLASIDELSDRTDRLQELLLAIAQELANRPADPSPAVTPPTGPTMEDLAQRIERLAQGSADGRILDSRLAAIEAELNRRRDAEGDLQEAIAAERQATMAAVSSAVTAALSRLDGELGAQLRSIETMFGGLGDALANRIGAALTPGAGTGRAALDEQLTEIGRRTTDAVTDAVRSVVAGAASELQRSTSAASAATNELASRSQEALTSFRSEADHAVAALVERIDAGAGGAQDASAAASVAAREAVTEAVSAAVATAVATFVPGAVADALEAPLRQLEAVTAQSAELVDAVAGTETRTASIAERIWADSTRALEAFSDEAGEAVVSTAAGAQRAADAAVDASRAGWEIAAAVRAELVGLRQALRSALADGAARGGGVDIEAVIGAITEAEGGHLAGVEAAAIELRGSIDSGNAAMRNALDTVLASMAGTLDAVAGVVDRQERMITAGTNDTVAGVQEVVGGLREVVSHLLADQLVALDHRQGLIEDGLRAMWARLDRVDTSIDEALMTPPVLPPDLTLDLQASIRDAIEVAIAGALAHEESRLIAAHDSIEAAVARIEAGPGAGGDGGDDVVTAVAQLREQLAAGVAALPDHMAAILTPLPEGVASAVRDRFSAELRATVLELTGRMESALSRLPTDLAATVGLPADTIAAAVAEQVRTGLGRDLAPLIEQLTVASAGLPAKLEVIPNQIATAVADLAERIAATVTSRTADDLMAGLSAQIAAAAPVEVLERLPGLVADAVTERVGVGTGPLLESLPDVLTAAVGELRTQVRTELAQSLEQVIAATASLPARLDAIAEVSVGVAAVPEQIERTLAGLPAAVAAAAEAAVGAAVESAVTGAVTDAVADRAGDAAALADRTADRTAERVTEQLSAVLGTRFETLPDELTEVVRGVPEYTAALVVEAVEAATARAVAGLPAPEVITSPPPVDPTEAIDALRAEVGTAVTDAVRAEVGTAVTEAVRAEVGTAVTDAVRAAIADMPAPAPAAAPAATGAAAAESPVPDLVAGMVSAVAAALQEFGERVQHDLDDVGARIEDLSGVLQQTIEVFTEIGVRRRESRGEALVLLRQVVNEAADGSRSDTRARKLPTAPPASGR